MSPLSQFSIAISIAAVIAVALYQANMQGLTVGSFAAFMAALGQIFDPMKRLTKIASSMQRMLISAESVFTLIDQAPESRSSSPARKACSTSREVRQRSEEHTSELQSLMRISYAVFCLKKKKNTNISTHNNNSYR